MLLAALATGAAFARDRVDASQAEAMLNLLDRCHKKEAPRAFVDEVMAFPGTRLIIAQQNISRRITSAQYKIVLAAACQGKSVHIDPSEPGARAAKGVEGLIADVAPSLLWGMDHVGLLKDRLVSVQRNTALDQVAPLALQNLPETVDLAPRLYLVMGGRAGAAALDDGIYVDLLSDVWRSKGQNTPMTPREVVEFFAHEAHHAGYGEILDRRKQRLHLAGGQQQAWSFLTALMMEGSATLLVNAHGRWTELEQQHHIQPDLARLPRLLSEAQSLFRRILSGKIGDQEYETAISDFFGEGYHATGARLLYVIGEARGRSGILQVMKDPRSLLTIYNQCAAQEKEPFRFDPQIAQALLTIGN
jgi:Putative zinc dependent peptidase (DUF5700)